MKIIPTFLLLIGALAFGQRTDFKAVDFKTADSIAALYAGANLKSLPILTHNLTSDLATDVEKFRAIYTWVGTNIENDYSSYLKTRKNRKKLSGDRAALVAWNNSFTPKVFENLLKHNKTACTGYAYLVRELASLAGIECKIIDGYGKTATLFLDENSLPNHSWNAVQLNNKWYLCDPTWSAGKIVIEDGGPRFDADYFDGYFLADPAFFLKNHYPLEPEWALTNEVLDFKTFVEGPIIYKEAFRLGVMPSTPVQMRLETIKNEPLSFNLISQNKLEKKTIELVLYSGGSHNSIQPQITQNGNGYVLTTAFKRTGKYDVHIKVDDVIIATYVVRVRRK